MKNELKLQMIRRARLARGLVNLLRDDVECINIDADTFDLFNIAESIIEARTTVNKINANLDELVALVGMSKKDRK